MTEIILNKKQISDLIKVLRQVKKLKYRKLKSQYSSLTNYSHYEHMNWLVVIIQNNELFYFNKKENRYNKISTEFETGFSSIILGERSFIGLLDFLALCKKYKEEKVVFEETEDYLVCKIDGTIMKFKRVYLLDEEWSKI